MPSAAPLLLHPLSHGPASCRSGAYRAAFRAGPPPGRWFDHALVLPNGPGVAMAAGGALPSPP